MQGTIAFWPTASRPAFSTVNPSTSFCGAIALMTAASSMCRGNGSWTRIPFTALSAFSRPISASSSSCEASAASRCCQPAIPASSTARPFERT